MAGSKRDSQSARALQHRLRHANRGPETMPCLCPRLVFCISIQRPCFARTGSSRRHICMPILSFNRSKFVMPLALTWRKAALRQRINGLSYHLPLTGQPPYEKKIWNRKLGCIGCLPECDAEDVKIDQILPLENNVQSG